MLPENPRRAGLEHLHGRQVASVPDRRDEPGRPAPQLAVRAWFRALVRLPRRRDQPVASRAGLRQPPGGPAEDPEEGYHLTDDITGKALEFIKDAKAIAPEKPFFLYYAPGACHAPHHAPKECDREVQGSIRHGLRGHARATLARQKKMGLVPPDTELPPINPIGTPETRTGPDGKPFPLMDATKPWDSLSDGEKELFSRMAEVYAGFPGARRPPHRAAARLPRVLRSAREHARDPRVRQRRQRRGRPHGSVNENRLFNGMPDDLESALKMLDELGGPMTYNHYANGWAMAFNTPFKMWKRYEFNGGTSDLIITWPGGMKAKGEIRQQYHHAIDIVPTILDTLGVDAGHDQGPRADPLRRRRCATALKWLRRRQPARRSSTRCWARAASGTTAGRPSRPARRSAGGAVQRRHLGAVPHRHRPGRAARPGG